MKHYLVAPVPCSIMRVQNRFVLIRVKTPAQGLFSAQHSTQARKFCLRPGCALPPHRFSQSPISRIEVMPDQRRHLIVNLMSPQRHHLRPRTAGSFEQDRLLAFIAAGLKYARKPHDGLAKKCPALKRVVMGDALSERLSAPPPEKIRGLPP